MRHPLPRVASIRDFYAFEQHVATCRRHRGLEMASAVVSRARLLLLQSLGRRGPRRRGVGAREVQELDYELELACVIGRAARDLPADDRAGVPCCGFTIMNDWSARDLQREEMAVGLGPSKGKDFATSLGPEVVPFDELADGYKEGRLHLEMTAAVNGRVLSRATRARCTGPGPSSWPMPAGTRRFSLATCWARARSARADPRADPRGRRRLAQARRHRRAGDRTTRDTAQSHRPPPLTWPGPGANPMPPYLRLGSVPRKRHTAHPHRPGFKDEGIYYEEVVTLAGFSRAYSLVYHLRPPTRVVRLEPAGSVGARSPRPGRPPAPSSQDARPSPRGRSRSPGVSFCWPTTTSRWPDAVLSKPQQELFRNADADEVLFVHCGRGACCTRCSVPCPFVNSIIIIIPRCTTYRLEFEPGSLPDLLVIEARERDDSPPVSQSRRPDSAGISLQRARPSRPDRGRRRSTSRRRPRCSSRTAGGSRDTRWPAIPSTSWAGMEWSPLSR